MNAPSIVILILIGLWATLSIVYWLKNRGVNGCSGCSGDCTHCSSQYKDNLKK